MRAFYFSFSSIIVMFFTFAMTAASLFVGNQFGLVRYTRTIDPDGVRHHQIFPSSSGGADSSQALDFFSAVFIGAAFATGVVMDIKTLRFFWNCVAVSGSAAFSQ